MNRRLFLATGIAVSTCYCSDVLGQTGNFRGAAESINATIRANHYRRTDLDSDAYRQIEKDVIALGERAPSAVPDRFADPPLDQLSNRSATASLRRPSLRAHERALDQRSGNRRGRAQIDRSRQDRR
jgi:hypothetical protein